MCIKYREISKVKESVRLKVDFKLLFLINGNERYQYWKDSLIWIKVI